MDQSSLGEIDPSSVRRREEVKEADEVKEVEDKRGACGTALGVNGGSRKFFENLKRPTFGASSDLGRTDPHPGNFRKSGKQRG